MLSQINHSYFLVFNEELGFTHVFTFFSEFNRDEPYIVYVEAFLLMLIAALSFVENILLLSTFLRYPSLLTATNGFLLNMTLSSLLIITSAPIIAITRITESWLFVEAVCKFSVLVMHTTSFVLIWSMVLISADRYRRIVYPKRKQISKKQALFACLAVWTICLIFIPQAIFSKVETVQLGTSTISFCTVLYPYRESRLFSNIMFAVVIGFLMVIPITAMLYNYISILIALRSISNKTSRYIDKPRNSNGFVRSMSIAQSRRNIRHRRIVCILISIMVLHTIMWSPVFFCLMAIQWEERKQTFELKSSTFIGTVIVCFANTCVNPVLYVFNDKKTRHAMGKWMFLLNKSAGLTASTSDPVDTDAVNNNPLQFNTNLNEQLEM